MSSRVGQMAPQLFTTDYGDMMYRNGSISEWTEDMLSGGAAAVTEPQSQASPQTNRRNNPTPSNSNPGILSNTPSYPQTSVTVRPNDPSSLTNTANGSSSSDTCGTPPPLSHIAASNGTLDDKFEFLLECTQAIGSDNFDALAITYYTGKFGSSTPLANEQRLSRNRGLPKLIGEVHNAAREWSDWERRGFYEEVLRTTELVLVGEVERGRASLRDVAGSNGAGAAWNGTSGPGEAVVAGMKRVVEDEVSTFCLTEGRELHSANSMTDA